MALVFACSRAEAQSAAAAGFESYSSDQVKAAFLFHFCSYVTWPEQTPRKDPITIAVLDAPEVAAELERFVAGRTIQGRPIEVKRMRSIRALGDEELLFIGAENNRRLKEILQEIGRRPTLTVTDAPDGLAAGAMINFQIVDNHERFEISLARARDAGLMLSSRLLAAALRVETTRCAAARCNMHERGQRQFASWNRRTPCLSPQSVAQLRYY
ncbi:MAG TPA: YfiR family protein [Gammaproteobacteria bacterium]|nr:YfiR family protein [Gammaproteobacteria bacterium]